MRRPGVTGVSHFHNDSHCSSETSKLLKFFNVTLNIEKRRLTNDFVFRNFPKCLDFL